MCLGALRGEHSLKVARSARAVQRFPLSLRFATPPERTLLWTQLLDEDGGKAGSGYPPPVSFPTPCRSPGGGGASLGLPKIFRCGSLCCCVGGCVVGHYHLHPLHSWQDILLTFAEMELDNTTMFPPGTSVMFIRSTGEPFLAQVVGHSEHGDAYRRISYDRDGKTVLHDRASVRRLSLPRAPSPPRPAQSEASSSTRAEQRALVHRRPKRSLQSTLHVEQDQEILHRAGQGVGLRTLAAL